MHIRLYLHIMSLIRSGSVTFKGIMDYEASGGRRSEESEQKIQERSSDCFPIESISPVPVQLKANCSARKTALLFLAVSSREKV